MTNQEKIKEGTTLIAIDVCKMCDSDEQVLTIGKKYKVLAIDHEKMEFLIIDDELSAHYFDIENYTDFFKLHNKTWIKIESQNDLPKEYGHFWVCNKINNQVEIDYIDWDNESHIERWMEFNSHYKPIKKPKPPLF